MKEWLELTKLTGDRELVIERVRVRESGIRLEGEFELPPIATLSSEDQVFVAAFVRSHGSIKQMEKVFGISYPTVKNRLNKISERLNFLSVEMEPESSDVLDLLDKGEIDVKEAIERLKR